MRNGKRKRQQTNENVIIEDQFRVDEDFQGKNNDDNFVFKKPTILSTNRREKIAVHCSKKMKRIEICDESNNDFDNANEEYNSSSPSEDIENKKSKTSKNKKSSQSKPIDGKLFDISNNNLSSEQHFVDKKKHIHKSLSTFSSTSSIIVAAQKSSYFLLTPATSTTSLHDVSSTSCLQQQQNKLTDIKTNTMKNSKKQQQQVEETKENKEEPSETKTQATTTTTSATATKKTTARKRAATSRRRPSMILCNTSVSSSSSTSTSSTIRRPIAQNVPESKITSSNANHAVAHKQAKLSLSVSAATKSCSNLQKSSVLADVAAVVSEASKPPTTTFPNPIGAGVSLSQFYLRYAPKNSFYSTSASIRSCHRKFGPSNPMPELTWASSSALWSAMKDKEQNYLRDAAYLKRHPGIKSDMRSILIEWLCEVASAYSLHRETLHLTIEYIDRFMSESKMPIHIDRLQLMGTTALYLAAKVEEIYPPTLEDFASKLDSCLDPTTGNPEKALRGACESMIGFELYMLKALNWEISPVTANTWLQTYLQIAAINFSSLVDSWWTKAALRDSFDELEFDFFLESTSEKVDPNLEYKTSIVMPLSIYKNSNKTAAFDENESEEKRKNSEFFLTNYERSIALIDLCLFDYDHMQFAYSELAAAALYHTVCSTTRQRRQRRRREEVESDECGEARFARALVENCSGFLLDDIERCVKWMQPYADVCEQKLGGCEPNHDEVDENAHNVQTFRDYGSWLKEVKSRTIQTPSKPKFYNPNPNQSLPPTPPDSHRVSVSSTSILSSTSFTTLKNTDD